MRFIGGLPLAGSTTCHVFCSLGRILNSLAFEQNLFLFDLRLPIITNSCGICSFFSCLSPNSELVKYFLISSRWFITYTWEHARVVLMLLTYDLIPCSRKYTSDISGWRLRHFYIFLNQFYFFWNYPPRLKLFQDLLELVRPSVVIFPLDETTLSSFILFRPSGLDLFTSTLGMIFSKLMKLKLPKLDSAADGTVLMP
jgi:hypothetical protein